MVNQTKRKYHISGSVIDRKTRRGIEGLQVEGWDKDLIYDDLVGSTVSDEQGAFQIELDASYFRELFQDRQPDLFFKVFSKGAVIKSTEDSVLWNVNAGATEITIEVDVPALEEPILLNSMTDLQAYQDEILRRIHSTNNGGFLFLTHPFCCSMKLAFSWHRQSVKR